MFLYHCVSEPCTGSRYSLSSSNTNQTGMEIVRPEFLPVTLILISRYREIKISVTGRNSGRTISIPVWFVLEDDKLYLLPVQGSDTQWYKNILKSPSFQLDAHGAEAQLQAVPITDA